MLNFWFRAVPGSEERKRTKIRFGRFLVPKNRKEPRFETSEDRKKRNQDSFVLTKIRKFRAGFRVPKNGKKRTNVHSETDKEQPDGKRKIIVYNLSWRSDELINFL
ncbi:unnamed protein product [Rhizophagus irregularis]|nr:unnamed protein product [Rhizophagus irregularis]